MQNLDPNDPVYPVPAMTGWPTVLCLASGSSQKGKFKGTIISIEMKRMTIEVESKNEICFKGNPFGQLLNHELRETCLTDTKDDCYSSSRFRFLTTAGLCPPLTHPDDCPSLSQHVQVKFSGYWDRFSALSMGPWQSESQSTKLSSLTSISPNSRIKLEWGLGLGGVRKLTWMKDAFGVFP